MPGYPFRARVIPEPGGEIALIQIGDVEQQAWTTPDRLTWVSNRDHRFDKHLLAPGDVLFTPRVGYRHRVFSWPRRV